MFKKIAFYAYAFCFTLDPVLSAINPNLETLFKPERSSEQIDSLRSTRIVSEFLVLETLEHNVKVVKISLDVSAHLKQYFPGNSGTLNQRFITPNDDSIVPTGFAHSGNLRTKSLFGLYPRSPVRSMLNYPERTVGHLGDQCSATLVGPRHALTAAHCVFDLEKNTFFELLDFAPGKVGHREPFGSFRPRQIFIPKSYVELGDTQSDYALLIFETDIGERLGWVGYGQPAIHDSIGKIIGYPEDKSFATPWMSQCPLSFRETTVVHQCDTTQGMSGAAILTRGSLGAPDSYLVAIHTHGGVDFNGGKKLDSKLYHLLRMWFEFDYIGSPTISLLDYEFPKPTDYSIEFKNLCSQAIVFEAVIGENVNRSSRQLIQPGETKVSFRLTELLDLKINAQTFGTRPSRQWSRRAYCSYDDTSCFLPIDWDQMRKVHEKSYRYEFRCDSAANDNSILLEEI